LSHRVASTCADFLSSTLCFGTADLRATCYLDGKKKATADTDEDGSMARDKREKRELHALNEDGMVLCNPRDREAAHRAEMEGIATEDYAAVTCRNCLELLHKLRKEQRDR
jgi:hypothetical protein